MTGLYRISSVWLLVATLACGCAGIEVAETEDPSGDASQSSSSVSASPVAPTPSSSAECVPVRVLESVIQLHRVVIVLDAGSAAGIRTGMAGALDNGRPFRIISVDSRPSSAVITGLNIRIAPGSQGCVFLPAR